MSASSDKIHKIISEIEGGFGGNPSVSQKTAGQIMEILLADEPSLNNAEPNGKENYEDHEFHFDIHDLSIYREMNNQLYQIDYYRPLYNQRKFLRKPILFFRRVIRRLLRFLIEPMVESQNAFNGSVTASINALYNNAILSQSFMDATMAKLVSIVRDINKNSELMQNTVSESSQIIAMAKNDDAELWDKIRDMKMDFDATQSAINSVFESLSSASATMDMEMDDLRNRMSQQQKMEIETLIARLTKLEVHRQEIDVDRNAVQEAIRLINEMVTNTSSMSQEQKMEMEGLVTRISVLEGHSQKIDADRNDLLGLNSKVEGIYSYLDHSELQILRAIKKNQKCNEVLVSYISKEEALDEEKNIKKIHIGEGKNTYNIIDYFDFENHFRGSRKNIKQSQESYLTYFKNCRKNIVDLGCGRGEFLELLKQHNIQAVGVDMYKEFVDYCQLKELNVVHSDAIAYLSSLEDASIGGVFASQLVEHLETDQLVAICKKAYEKLDLGGYLVMETPNPKTLAIYTNSFYIDPSHVKPVHPLTLEYFLKQSGFRNIQVVYTEQSKQGYRLPLLNGEQVHNLSEFNDGVNLLSDILFGSMDYAIIAQK